jgi:predicted HAD superfamily hydrolase
MYLESPDLEHLVKRIIGDELKVRVYSSADFGYGKGCGALYGHLAEDQGVGLSKIFHLGDNWYADFHVPSRMGIPAEYVPRPVTWRLARKMRTHWFHRALSSL